MSKFVFGPGIGWLEKAAAAGAARPVVTLGQIQPGGVVTLTIGPSDPAAPALLSLAVCYLPSKPAAADDPKAVLDAAAIKGLAAAVMDGDLTVTVAPAPTPGASYWVQTILEIPD